MTQQRIDLRAPAEGGASASCADEGLAPESERGGKKERVLHTRVPALLERELKRFADNLRVPVSNLVRAILEDALSVADAAGTNLEERLKSAAQTIENERERLKKRVSPERPSKVSASIFAFQEAMLAQPTACTRCGKALPRGSRAHLGLSESGLRRGFSKGAWHGPNVIVCDACLPREPFLEEQL